jgi:hypothetical protein
MGGMGDISISPMLPHFWRMGSHGNTMNSHVPIKGLAVFEANQALVR